MPRRDSGRVPWRGLGAAGLYAGNSKRSSRRRPIWRCATITGIRVRHLNLVLPGKTTKTGRACSHCDANSLRTRFSVAGDEPKRPGRLDHSMQATVQQNEAGPSAHLGQTVRQATRSAKAASALRGEGCYGVSVPSSSASAVSTASATAVATRGVALAVARTGVATTATGLATARTGVARAETGLAFAGVAISAPPAGVLAAGAATVATGATGAAGSCCGRKKNHQSSAAITRAPRIHHSQFRSGSLGGGGAVGRGGGGGVGVPASGRGAVAAATGAAAAAAPAPKREWRNPASKAAVSLAKQTSGFGRS